MLVKTHLSFPGPTDIAELVRSAIEIRMDEARIEDVCTAALPKLALPLSTNLERRASVSLASAGNRPAATPKLAS